jgi:chloramphenicol 3-O-phosphotransferase
MGKGSGPGSRVVVVGPCAAGKTTLVGNLRPRGYDVRSCAQEHSYVPDLWQRFAGTDVLIYLDAQLPAISRRQQRSDWTQEQLDTQRERLAHARTHCDFYLATDSLTREEVAARVQRFLQERGIPARAEEQDSGLPSCA